ADPLVGEPGLGGHRPFQAVDQQAAGLPRPTLGRHVVVAGDQPPAHRVERQLAGDEHELAGPHRQRPPPRSGDALDRRTHRACPAAYQARRNACTSGTTSSLQGTGVTMMRVAPAASYSATRARISSTDVAATSGSPASMRSVTRTIPALKPPSR